MPSSGDIYNRKFGGELKLKGRSKLKGIRSKKSTSNDPETTSVNSTQILGTGRILSTGKTIQGFETKFLEEVKINDILIIKHPLTHMNEERVIEGVLSHRTLCIDEAFSSDLITTTQYFIRKPESSLVCDKEDGNVVRNKTSQIITIREKTGMWGYKTVTKVVKSNLSAEDRLNERVKLSRDKYCW